MRRVSAALAIAGFAALFITGCVVHERDGYDGSYRDSRDHERRDDERDRREDRRDDDRREGERGRY